MQTSKFLLIVKKETTFEQRGNMGNNTTSLRDIKRASAQVCPASLYAMYKPSHKGAS
jgi:hypothetical protein